MFNLGNYVKKQCGKPVWVWVPPRKHDCFPPLLQKYLKKVKSNTLSSSSLITSGFLVALSPISCI